MELQKKTYNVPEAAKVLGISVPKLYQLCHTDDFPAVRLGARIVIPIDRLDQWLDEKASKSKYKEGCINEPIHCL